jgi:uncharacterized damage-inducible protein DinB
MDTTLLQPMFRFNTSANEQVRQAAHAGGEALMRSPQEQWYGSVYHLLVHLCRAERNWLLRLRDGAVPPANTGDDEFPSLEPLLELWRDVDQQWERYVASLSPDALAATARTVRRVAFIGDLLGMGLPRQLTRVQRLVEAE